MLHVVIVKLAKAQLKHQDISIVDQVHAGDVRWLFGINLAGFFTLAEKHDGLKAVLGKAPSEHGQAFFAAVFLIA